MMLLNWLVAIVLIGISVGFFIWKKSSRNSEKGKNPFQNDSKRPYEGINHDSKARDALLKQGFTNQKVEGQQFDVIIVGSGMGGLACGALLSRVGKKVLVLEKHDQAGGCLHVFQEKGFEFDTGVHYMGELGPKNFVTFILDQLLEGQVKFSPMNEVFDRVIIGLSNTDRKKVIEVEMRAGKQQFIDALLKVFPNEEKAILKWLSLMKEMKGKTMTFFAHKFIPLWAAKILNATGLVNIVFPFFKEAQKPLKQILDEITTNQDLKAVLAYSWGDYGTPPGTGSFAMQSLIQNHYLSGGFYPDGGSAEISYHLVRQIEKNGGKVLVRAEVEEIVVEERENGPQVVGVRVKKGNGNTIRSGVVVSDAGIPVTCTQLLKSPVSKWHSDVLAMLQSGKLKHGMGGLQIFIGLEGTTEELGLKAQNIWAYGSNNFDQIVKTFMAKKDAIQNDVFEAPGMFISFPSAKDPTWKTRFPNVSTCEIVSFANWDWFSEWQNERVMHRGDEYELIKDKIFTALWNEVLTIHPQLKDKVRYFSVGTPVTNLYYLNLLKGEMYGLEHDIDRFSPEASLLLRGDTDVKGLFLTGQDVAFCGVVGALLGAYVATSKVLNRNVVFDMMNLKKRIEKSNK